MGDEREGPNENAQNGLAVPITLEVPAGLVRDYDAMVGEGIYLSREEALRHALVVSWRHDRGRWHTVRLDFLRDGDRPDTGVEHASQGGEPEEGQTATDSEN